MAKGQSRTPGILKKYEKELLADWVAELKAAGSGGDGRIGEAELQHVAALGPRSNRDLLAELARELALEPACLDVDRRLGAGAARRRLEQRLHRLLDFARRPAVPHDLAREPHLPL